MFQSTFKNGACKIYGIEIGLALKRLVNCLMCHHYWWPLCGAERTWRMTWKRWQMWITLSFCTARRESRLLCFGDRASRRPKPVWLSNSSRHRFPNAGDIIYPPNHAHLWDHLGTAIVLYYYKMSWQQSSLGAPPQICRLFSSTCSAE